MQIVIAKAWTDYEVSGPYRRDLGEAPPMREVLRAKAAMWLNHGTEADVTRAQAHCDSSNDGWEVLTFPPATRDPLGAAKRIVLGAVKVRATT